MANSYEYDPYRVIAESLATLRNAFTFTGYQFDEGVGLYFAKERYYQPSQGRFLTQDTYTGSAWAPWTQHLYGYVGNNPVNWVDPTGHIPKINVDGGWGGAPDPEYQEELRQEIAHEEFRAQEAADRIPPIPDCRAHLHSKSYPAARCANLHPIREELCNQLTGLSCSDAMYAVGASPEMLGFSSYASLASTTNAAMEAELFSQLMAEVETLDVATAANQAVFYSGPGQRALAEQFALQNRKLTVELTPGGRWLNSLGLFERGSPMSYDHSLKVWERLSERFAEGASGTVNAFIDGASSTGVFARVEYPTLLNNAYLRNVLTGGH